MKKFIVLYSLFCIIVTFAIFLPYSRTITYALPNAVDPVFYAWNIEHNLQSATHGFGDLLDTNIFYPEGNTLAFSDTLYAQTILTAPIIVLTKNPVLAENLYILLTFPMAAIAMFFLSYEITRHKWASALSGIFFAFCYPRLAQVGHLPMISSQWIPLFVLFFLKFLKTGSSKFLLLTFLFFVLNITSSIYFGVFLFPIIVIALLIEPEKWKHIIKNMLIWFIPMMIVLGIVLYPYIRLKAEYPAIRRSLEDTGRLSAQTRDYLTILPTSLLANTGVFRTETNEKPLYLTVTLLVLAGLGIFLGWKRQKKYVIFFSISALTAYLLSLGPTTQTSPYTLLYRIFPLMQIVRVPARFVIIVVFSLAGLAAIGLSRINKKGFLLLALIIFLIEVWQINTPSVPIPVGKDIPKIYQWLNTNPANDIIVELPLRPLWRGISMEEQLMRTYRETRDEDVYASETYRIYFSTLHHKRMLNGYSGFFPQIYHDQAGLLDNFPTPESLAMLKQRQVRYILIHAWQYTDKNFSDIKRQIDQYPELQLVQQFEDDYVYEL